MPNVYCDWKHCEHNKEDECTKDVIDLSDINGTDEYGEDVYALECEQFERRKI